MYPVRFAVAAVLGGVPLFGVYVATSWSVQAELETAARLISDRAAKQDRLPVARPAPPAVAVSKVVTRIEVLPDGGRTVTLEDDAGQVLYRSDPIRQETVVTRGGPVPAGQGGPTLSVPVLGSADPDPFAAKFGASPVPSDADAVQPSAPKG